MASIYTCPACRRRYTIYKDGDYICECGNVFCYPPLLSRERACFISMDVYRDQQARTRRCVAVAIPPKSSETRTGWRRALRWAASLL